MDKGTTIIVVTHKGFDDSILNGNRVYRVIRVGNSVGDNVADSKGWLRDDTGESMAGENPWYCELTALYWNWKNMDAGITGLVHYRRFFVNSRLGSQSIAGDILTGEQIKRILDGHRIILPPKVAKPKGRSSLYRHKSPEDQDRHWLVIESIIQQYYPSFLRAFTHVLYESHATYCLNMFITTRELMDEYCEWLFDVLKKYDDAIAGRGESRMPRVDGFLSEVLLQVWVEHRFRRNEIYYVPVMQVRDDMDYYYGKSCSSMIRRMVYSSNPLAMLVWKTRSFIQSIPRRC
ncbi:MAG: DUF4422 domain-containing protein [Bacteroidales bacterium]|nr:DUF4422 domain-containing protein [Bacteroidales bacterium]